MKINNQAKILNDKIKNNSKTIYHFLSNKGKRIYFPKLGVPQQSVEAEKTKYNATAGVALFDDKTYMNLKSMMKYVNLSSKEVVSYSSIPGNNNLRLEWKNQIKKKNFSIKKNFSNPITSIGLTGGLSIICSLFFEENDSIIIPSPYWENYDLIFNEASKVKVETFDLFLNNKFNFKQFELKLNESKKPIILFNFPNNPTGYSLTNEEVNKLLKLFKQIAKTKKMMVICDDAYFGLNYEKNIFNESLFSKLYNLDENLFCIKLDAVTKEEYSWGLRIGFITYGIKNANDELFNALEEKTSGIIRTTVSNAPTISQSLIYNSFKSKNYNKEKKENYEILKKRYKEVKKVLSNKKYEKYFSPLPFNSGYFMCVKLKNINSELLRILLIKKYSTGIVTNGDLIRIAYSSLRKDEIKIIFENIYNACKEIK